MSAPVNLERTAAGKVRPVCEFCGRKGRAVTPDECGRVSLWDLARGWSCAPYPEHVTHPDGSTGTLYQCPACTRRLDRGEALTSRGTTTKRVVM
ncbi:hypothetical protein GCM10023168_13890 [Fodinibacter luteus]|uniref:Uncharacterized protein n=1 Tax=Fodinibacter luteus TaxID=552064 RepID=A0ABP8K9R6_9MICO